MTSKLRNRHFPVLKQDSWLGILSYGRAADKQILVSYCSLPFSYEICLTSDH